MPRKKKSTEAYDQAEAEMQPKVVRKRKTRAKAKEGGSVTHKKNNFIQHFMDTAQQPGIVRGVLILGGVLIALSCAGILYVYFSEQTYTTMSPAAQNKMIAASLRIENNLSPQENLDVIKSLKTPAPPVAGNKKVDAKAQSAMSTVSSSGENVSIVNGLK